MIELDPACLETIGGILDEHVPGCEVRVFGSRVSGEAHKYSDLDLAIKCPKPLTSEVMQALMDAFSESDLPILVDVSDWHELSEGMRNRIERQHEIIRRQP